MNVIAKDCWTKRLSLLLTIMLLLSLAAPAFAAETAHAGPFVVTERHAYNVAQGVQETELHLNTTDGDEQNLAHVMEIDLSDPTVSLRAGYKNYDGSHWGLQTVPEQVAAAEPHFREQNAAANVVGAINGCYYNIHTPKTESGVRTIPMVESVRNAFEKERYYHEALNISCRAEIDGYTDFIFINRFGNVQNQATLNKAIKRIVRDCNAEMIHFDI